MNVLIVYKSKTGFTKKYAEWIAKELSCEAMAVDKAVRADLGAYEKLVYGGGLIAGSLNGFGKIKTKFTNFNGEKFIFIVGATPEKAVSQEQIKQTVNQCVAQQDIGKVQTFYMQGGINYEHMPFVYKIMMKAFCSLIKKQKGADSEQYKMISKSYDISDKSYIAKLCDALRA